MDEFSTQSMKELEERIFRLTSTLEEPTLEGYVQEGKGKEDNTVAE